MQTALAPTTSTVPATLQQRADALARGSRAENTWKAYAADWAVWKAWAVQHGASVLPADPLVVAHFLTDLSASRKLSTLRRYLASISVAHTLQGLTFERRSPAISTIMKGIGRERGSDRRKARPLMVQQALAMIRDMGGSLVDCRDAALLALGLAMAARRSELTGLDWMKRGTGRGVLELTESGATIRLHNSKTGQGKDVEVYLLPGIALRAVREWVERAGIAEGAPLMRAVTRQGRVSPQRLNDRSVARVVKRRCEAAGLDAEYFSGHSLRSGMITTAAELGEPEWRIAMTSRHSPQGTELRGYIQPVEKRRHALTNVLGL